MVRWPGRCFIRNPRLHDGHSISTLITFAVSVNCVSHPPQRNSAGRSSIPAMRTFEQEGHEMRSFIHCVRVGSWSVRTLAPQSSHCISPRAEGNKPLHFGHERGGGAILDSTVNSSSMIVHPVFDFGLFAYSRKVFIPYRPFLFPPE